MNATLKEKIPLIARNEGVWDGYYRYYNAAGDKVDEHKSRLICRFPTPDSYHQTNHYHWSDGRSEIRDFPSNVENGKLIFFTDIEGWAAEVDLDEARRTTMLHWVRKNEPDLYLYEMIQNSDCGQYRARVWQWFRGGRLSMRTLIDEQRRADDWRPYDEREFSYAEIGDA
ncbi:MAG: DUF3598 domain-containing protein [Pseudomonadota bacterium]